MAGERPFRFGFQLSGDHLDDPVAAARRAEELGFDTVLVADHVGSGPSPMITLAAIAQATTTIRLGPFVLNNDMRNPVQLAWEAATLDRLSGGRLELGLGAGHTPQEYAATGIEFAPARTRKERLASSVETMRGLFGSAAAAGEIRLDAPSQDRLPILIGGNGAALLGHAGAHAVIIGLQGLGRTMADGHRHNVKFGAGWLDTQIEQIEAGAGGRFDQIELNALVQIVDITDDREQAIATVCERAHGLSSEDAAATPYLLLGTVDEIVAHLQTCRQRWGISYFAVRELDGFESVLRAAADVG